MSKNLLIFISFTFVILLSSCKTNTNSADVELARVYDHYLFLDDLEQAIPQNIYGKDSLLFVQEYINNWIINELVIAQAENNLAEEKKDFKKELEEYRNSLLVYNYERMLVNQKLDTLVSEIEIKEFYEKRKSEFPLPNSYIRFIYGEISNNSNNLKKIRKFFYGNKEGRYDSLINCFEVCSDKSQYDSTLWIAESDAKKILPSGMSFTKKGKFTLPVDNSVFFVEIFEYRKKGDFSPIELIRDQIKQVVLNKRRAEIIQNMRNDIKLKAKNTNVIEVY